MATGTNNSFVKTRAVLDGIKDYIENCKGDLGASIMVLTTLDSVLVDVKTEIGVLKGAMILDGYESEDSCIQFLDDTLDNTIDPLIKECKEMLHQLAMSH